jgi:hypothetical protein
MSAAPVTDRSVFKIASLFGVYLHGCVMENVLTRVSSVFVAQSICCDAGFPRDTGISITYQKHYERVAKRRTALILLESQARSDLAQRNK